MRAAMASAEVGDDVYAEDPTVNLLEARAAEVFGREAAIFVPTGTMGNQIAIRLHTHHGQEVITESRAHVVDWEMAMAAAFSGVQLRTVFAERGIVGEQIVDAAEQAQRLRPRHALDGLGHQRSGGGGYRAALTFEPNILDPVARELEPQREPIAADRIESLDAGIGRRQRAKIAGPAIVVEDDVAVQFVEFHGRLF